MILRVSVGEQILAERMRRSNGSEAKRPESLD
jgi:hypothetical protein